MATSIEWVGSYLKSGNTWVRLLLTAYERGGLEDLNDSGKFGNLDLNTYFHRSVSPRGLGHEDTSFMPILRGAALLHMAESIQDRSLTLKTHHANADLYGFPMVPVPFVSRFIYVVRDPRGVAPSLASYLGLPIDEAIEFMADKDARVTRAAEGEPDDLRHLFYILGSWRLHVISYLNEERFPCLVVRYEDLQRDAAGELVDILEFMERDVDEDRVEAAVEACRFDRLQEMEDEQGFEEHIGDGKRFFRRGEADSWKDELTEEQEQRIKVDQGDAMRALGYLDS